MTKIVLQDLVSLTNETSALNTINANNTVIETASDNFLSRDGTTPNQMQADLDMNSNNILNLPAPAGASEPLRLQDLTSFVGGGSIIASSPGGSTGQVQYNAGGGSFGGDAGMTYNAATDTLTVTNTNTSLTGSTGLPISTGVSGLGTGIATFLATPSSANLASAITNETGSGALVFGTSPSITTPSLPSYMDMSEIAAPANPAADTARIYAKDVATVTQLFFRDSAGLETNLCSTVKCKMATFTRDLSLASGTQSITGVGFKPTHIIFMGGKNGASAAAVGMDDGTNRITIADDSVDSAGTYVASTAACMTFATVSGGNSAANIQTFDADGFTLNWTKTGSPTGTANIGYMAFRFP